jgi:oxygen-independent coproporphyrinogen III oxidase
MAGIYIHIPFCKQACHYCDFHFSTNLTNRSPMVEAIVHELHLQHDYIQGAVNTVYFGGGTPSILPVGDLQKILKTILSQYQITADPEVTIEANPDDLSFDKLSTLNEIGINRLSIGIQSFDDRILAYFNRSHSAADARKSIEFSRRAGFKNISVDLIYAVPGQSNEDWRENVLEAVALNAEHISAYALTIEPQTAFGMWHKKGKIVQVEDDTAAVQLEILIEELGKAGYEQYEVSNFSKPGFRSKHNSAYWKQEQYLGVGPSAHSYNGLTRQFNVSNNALYLKSIREGRIPFELDDLTREDHVNEYLLTTLRTEWGCDLRFLKERYDYDIATIEREYLDLLIKRNYAVIDGGFLKLTHSGRLLADKITSDLFMEKPPRLR